jgi:hypothetical protein
MSTEHYIYCQDCQEEVCLGKLINKRPDVSCELPEFLEELSTLVHFLAYHITYSDNRKHCLIVTDLDYLLS